MLLSNDYKILNFETTDNRKKKKVNKNCPIKSWIIIDTKCPTMRQLLGYVHLQ